MNEVMKMSRKALILAVTVSTLAWGVLATAMFAPLTTHAAGCTSGELIKGSLSAVYYCGADGKRYVFPNEKTYFTWYSDFSGVTTISDSDLASIQIGGNVTYRPGVKLIKIQSDPKTYAVSKDGTLHHVTSEAVAVDLYGSDWNENDTEDVSDAFFTNYTIGSPINSAGEYDQNAQMSGSQTINQDKGLSSNGEVSGTLSASLASDSPDSATVPVGATGVSMLKFHLTNNSSSAMTVNSATLKREGPGNTSDFSAVYLYEGSTRLTTGRTINSSTNEANFSGLGLTLNSGQTRTLWVAADFSTGAGGGNVHRIRLQSAKSGTTELSGTGFVGSDFTMASAQVGSVKITKTGTITDPKTGAQNAKIAEFKIEAGSREDVTLKRVTLFQGGNLSASNLMNLELHQGSNLVGTASGFDSKLRATFDVADFQIDKGQSRTFRVYADIGSSARSDDTIEIYVEEDADIHAVGNTYGYGVAVDRTNGNPASNDGGYDGASCDGTGNDDCSRSEVEAGQVTIAFNGPSSKDISDEADNEEVFNFSMTSQSNIEVRNLRLQVEGNDLVDDSGSSNVANYTDIKVSNTNTGATWWGPKDVNTGGSDTSQSLVFDDVQTLQAGTTYTFAVTLDVESGTSDGDTLTLTLNAFQGNDLRNLDNSTFLTPSDDVVPTGNIEGNQHTVREASLALSRSSTPTSQSWVKGSTGVNMVGFNLKAGDGANVTVTSMKLTGYIDANGSSDFTQGENTDSGNTVSVSDTLTSCRLMDGSGQLGTAESPGSGADGTMVFDGFNLTVNAGATKGVTVNCDVSNSAFRNGNAERVSFDVAATTDVTVQDPDGNTVAVSGPAPNGGTSPNVSQTIINSGTMSYALAPDDTESEARIVIAGQSNVTLAKFRLTAQNESLKQTKLRVSLNNTSDDEFQSLTSMSLYDGSTLIAGPTPVDSSGNADFSGFEFVVPKDDSKTLTVKGSTNSISNGATSGHDLKVMIDLTNPATGTFEYRGANSSTVVSTISTNDRVGKAKLLRKTKPTVSLAALPSTTLTSGSTTVSRLTVTADAAENVSLKSITWDLSRSGALGITSPKVREVGGTDISLTSALDPAGDTNCDSAESDTCQIVVAFDDEQTVSAGTSKTYELVVTTSSVDSNDAISTTVSASGTSSVTGELDNSVGTSAVDGDAIEDLDGAAASGRYNFVWSDNSAIPHNDTVDTGAGDDNGGSAASNDWTNGYLVKVLPTDAQTVQAP